MAYMLVGWDKNETWERVLYRFDRMVARGIRPFPMVFGDRHRFRVLPGLPCRAIRPDRRLALRVTA